MVFILYVYVLFDNIRVQDSMSRQYVGVTVVIENKRFVKYSTPYIYTYLFIKISSVPVLILSDI